MKLITACILFFLFHLELFSQEKIHLTISPLALFDDASFPTVQPGVLWKISNRIGWLTEVGIKYRKSTFEQEGVDTIFGKSNGLKLRTEARYYLGDKSFLVNNKKSNNKSASYVALNFFYSTEHHNNSSDYYYRRDTSKLKTDNFYVGKKVFGFNFLAGGEMPLLKRFMLNFYGGAGMRFRRINTKHKEIDPQLDDWVRPMDLTINGYKNDLDVKAGNSVSGSLCLGIRFCYQL